MPRMKSGVIGDRLTRAVQRGVLSHWLKRLQVAEGIVWLAQIQADAILGAWETIRCLVLPSCY